MASVYKLRCSLVGHEKDVRSVYPAIKPDNGILSGSRDVTARIWMPNPEDPGFTEAHVMRGHSNFVSAVCVMPPDDEFPQGVIMTGSNDNDILAFTLDSPSPCFKLSGHTDTVCTLAAGKFGSLLSGSWDKTAKVWLNKKSVMELKGHEAAVWAVGIMPEMGLMLTGSADKTIKMWKAGRCEKTFVGHTDCVRGLAIVSTVQFLSCSNDGSIRLWSMDGSCLNEFYGHSNFVYSLAVFPNGTNFVSTSEDRTLKIWENGECKQTIAHPTQSVWTCCILPNGDIVTGASDGVVRVFSCDPLRQASSEEVQAFEDTLAASSIPTQIGDIKTDDLVGPAALINPGKRDGQTLMVKDGGKIEAYQWNVSEKRWLKIGDVVGGSGGSQASSGKQLHEGKEYDFVFDVELTEGHPPLKLPYNAGDDPWMVAHHWLANNELSPLFLDQVAKFIQDQTKGVTLGVPAPPPSVSDPFTGGGRYIPGSTSGSSNQGGDPFTSAGRYVPSAASTQESMLPMGADPFTGAGSYRPSFVQTSSHHSHMHKPTVETAKKFFSHTSVVGFNQVNAAAVMKKLREFNSSADPLIAVPDDDLIPLEGLMNGENPHAMQMQTLWKLLQWPAGMLFPVLDIFRMTIKSSVACEHFCGDKDSEDFISLVSACLSPDSPAANQMLMLRMLCNICSHPLGQTFLITHRDRLISSLTSLTSTANKNLQIAQASLLLNYAVLCRSFEDMEFKSHCLSAAVCLAESMSDPEASFRLLVCLGTMLHEDQNCTELAKSLDVVQFVNKCRDLADPPKLHECAANLSLLLN
ncbi:hypothetical protein CAPTEDRAFT_160241 [Capitella teleta]|uniref:Phospholipase A-2-activating protein n=1 Tax=Capitella teleta TaxID=283909 RepID=R7TWZ5_CAPTE|nr:hypothetical protein CAPTEDRAFT_160241 [Capitella teleta]|eukprot:ELT98127.1 hypothetical protein CAPTEDRAFT_160241 [Capitella teleta]